MDASDQIPASKSVPGGIEAFTRFKDHHNKNRVSTGLTTLQALREVHPDFHVTVISADTCDLLTYASAGHAEAKLDTESEGFQAQRVFKAASRRSENTRGTLKDHITFGKYDYHWDHHSFLVYVAEWESNMRGRVRNCYILAKRSSTDVASGDPSPTDELILAASKWCSEVHKEIYVFDSGMWTKNKELWNSVQKASWNEVILDSAMKKKLIDDIEGFFDRKNAYKQFAVPWKRGIIFHGVPGNGKTISIKALMHSLSVRSEPVPSLYVKSFDACQGPQYSIRSIFAHARNSAPCLLIFEDIDSLVTDKVRSYFLNEVDGLESNDGIIMIGSTNHLEKLDPAISKRPSRFDRKYEFKLPAETERTAYCEYWRGQLANNASIDFPASLSPAISKLTEGFSFAYLKELFITALLIIVGDADDSSEQETVANGVDEETKLSDDQDGAANGVDGDASKPNGENKVVESNRLMRIIHNQVQTLKDEMDNTVESSEKIASQGDPVDFMHRRRMLRSIAY
ncbi:MAG: hypothetical protein M1830_005543 [Pleopsidium flavum]|nr:MAG: hypothetical protein M1830_005543 [Pleopsidium flavum]